MTFCQVRHFLGFQPTSQFERLYVHFRREVVPRSVNDYLDVLSVHFKVFSDLFFFHNHDDLELRGNLLKRCRSHLSGLLCSSNEVLPIFWKSRTFLEDVHSKLSTLSSFLDCFGVNGSVFLSYHKSENSFVILCDSFRPRGAHLRTRLPGFYARKKDGHVVCCLPKDSRTADLKSPKLVFVSGESFSLVSPQML